MRKVLLPLLSVLVAVVWYAPASSAEAGRAPLSGYQRMLTTYERLHRRAVWLGEHPRAALLTPPFTVRRAVPRSTVQDVQQISRDILPPAPGSEADTQAEPSIAVDPNDSDAVVAVFQQGRFPDIASVDPGFATSHDGGSTWTRGNLPNLTQAVGGPWERASDPVVAFGPDGAAYAATIALNQVQNAWNAVTIQRSDDGGLTWNDPVNVRLDTDPSFFNDKEWIAVDTFASSPHFGRIYATWDRIAGTGQPVQLSFSDDRGDTWSPMANVSGTVSGLGAFPLVQPNGNLTVVYLDVLRFQVDAQTSRDGGASFGPIATIDDCLAVDPPDQRDGGCIPTAAVDPVTGYLYAGWTDSRFRGDGLDDAVVSRSTDGGGRWGPLTKVNSDAEGSGLEHMTTALGAYGHFVHVTYLTRRRSGGTFSMTVRERYSVSADDGVSYGGELAIGPRIDLTWSAMTTGLHFLGDYMAVAAAPGVAHPVWCRSSKPPKPRAFHQTTFSATVLE